MKEQTKETPYTPSQVMENLKQFEVQLAIFPMSLNGGPGWVRAVASDIVDRGIGSNSAAVFHALDALEPLLTSDLNALEPWKAEIYALLVALAALKEGK